MLGGINVSRPYDQVLLVFRRNRVAFNGDYSSRVDGGGIAMDTASIIEGLFCFKAKLRVIFPLVPFIIFVMVIIYFEVRMRVLFRGVLRSVQVFSRLQIV